MLILWFICPLVFGLEMSLSPMDVPPLYYMMYSKIIRLILISRAIIDEWHSFVLLVYVL